MPRKETSDPIPKDLYDILACPVDKADVKYTKDKTGLQCQKCKYVYPIKEGIPIMLPPQMQEKQ
ncbi:Trm112 family protein [Candidatus Woesearchaeota archaeon]|nr:Trm112 family protein [Candidatus Woesearchaeota archaeon]